MRIIWIFFFFYITIQTSFACKCEDFGGIEKNIISKYDIVFQGEVDSVYSCTNGIGLVQFKIDELYKGQAEDKVQLQYDCITSCQMSFVKGERWIIYSKYFKFGKLKLNFCDPSRKLVLQGADYNTLSHKMTFEEEIQYLKSNMGIVQTQNPKDKINVEEHDLIIPVGKTVLYLIGISLIGFIGIYLVIRYSFKKKNK